MIFTWQLGNWKLYSLQDFSEEIGINFMAINADREALRDAGFSEDTTTISYNAVLIDTGTEKVLVDTGWGDALGNKGQLVGLLAEIGVAPTDITHLILTHGHADHYGGFKNVAGEWVFPNAQYFIAQTEWNHWTSPERLEAIEAQSPERAELIRTYLLPLADRFTFLDEHQSQVLEGIQLIPAPGHTPGHSAVLVENEAGTVLLGSDALLHPVHISHLDWHFGNDADHTTARATREKLLRLAVEKDAQLHLYHFNFPGVGKVHQNTEGNWEFTAC
jgi:glyoxylase-like metal-dependent hydrolase (beta-lactamase superfamily II)